MQSEYLILLILGVLLIVGPIIKSLMARMRMPSLVGYIFLGFLVSALNHQWSFISSDFDTVFSILAKLGVVALLFRVGLKSHTRVLLNKLPDASVIWAGDVLTNVALGFGVTRYILDLPLETSLVIAVAFSATSVAVSVSIWQELHKLYTSRGQLLVDVAELDDLSGVLLLAILLTVIPVIQGNVGELVPSIGITTVIVVAKLALFVVGCYLFSHLLEPAFTHFCRKWENSTTGLTISVLGSGLVIASVASILGFSLAIGALFAGLAFSRDPEAVRTDAKFSYLYEFLTPFFFIYIGLQINPAVVGDSIWLALILFIPAVLGKFAGVALPALRIVPKYDAVLLGISMVPRAEIAMVIVYQCHALGDDIISDGMFSAMVLVAVMTSVFAPLVLRYLLAQRARAG